MMVPTMEQKLYGLFDLFCKQYKKYHELYSFEHLRKHQWFVTNYYSTFVNMYCILT